MGMSGYKGRLEPVRAPPPFDEFRLLEESWRALRPVRGEHRLGAAQVLALQGASAALQPRLPTGTLCCLRLPGPCSSCQAASEQPYVAQWAHSWPPLSSLPAPALRQVIEHQMSILDENRSIRSDLPAYIDLARRLDLALESRDNPAVPWGLYRKLFSVYLSYRKACDKVKPFTAPLPSSAPGILSSRPDSSQDVSPLAPVRVDHSHDLMLPSAAVCFHACSYPSCLCKSSHLPLPYAPRSPCISCRQRRRMPLQPRPQPSWHRERFVSPGAGPPQGGAAPLVGASPLSLVPPPQERSQQ